MEPGIYRDYDEATYHREPGLSSTGAKRLLESPAKYRHEREHPIEQTPAMRLGSCIHTAILGVGQPFEVVDGDRRTKAVREHVAELEAAGTLVLSAKEGALVEAITDAVQAHPVAASVLADGEPEVSMCWADRDTGALCRGRIDWLNPKALVDVKSTKDASVDGFMREAANLGMDLQAAAYIDGYEQLTGERLPFLHIAVETGALPMVVVHQLPDDGLDRGARRWTEAKRLYAECVETGTWPAGANYPTNEISTGAWPRWAA